MMQYFKDYIDYGVADAYLMHMTARSIKDDLEMLVTGRVNVRWVEHKLHITIRKENLSVIVISDDAFRRLIIKDEHYSVLTQEVYNDYKEVVLSRYIRK